MNNPPSNGELLRRKIDLARTYSRELTPDEVRAEIKRLEAENARLLEQQGQPLKALPTNLLADREKRAKESAEALMRQMGLKHV